jgi:hypothetical protein
VGHAHWAEEDRQRVLPNHEAGEGGGMITNGRTLMSGDWRGHWVKGTWCGGCGLAEESTEQRIGLVGLNTCVHTRRLGKCHLCAWSRKVAGEAE